MLKDLQNCGSFYIQLVIEKYSGHIIDITLMVNPKDQEKTRFAYEHRIVKGLIPIDIKKLKDVGCKDVSTKKKTDEKMSQESIDKLIADFYEEDRNIRL